MQNKHAQRFLQLEGTLNVRDLGGYPTTDGRWTRWRYLVRADNLDQLIPVAQQQLLDYGVALVIDLRTSKELIAYPNLLAGSSEVVYYHLPLYDDELIERLDEWETLADCNRLTLEICQPQILTIFEAISDSNSDRAILFHCASGKDRTGLIAGLLLDLAGVPHELIAEDYSLSAGYLEPRITRWRQAAKNSGKDMLRFELEVSSDPNTMLDTLGYLQNQYGGTANYLTESCGVSSRLVEQLRANLLE